MNRSIARSVFVTNFFNPSPKDKELPRYSHMWATKPSYINSTPITYICRLQKPFARSEFEVSDVFQMSLSARGKFNNHTPVLLSVYIDVCTKYTHTVMHGAGQSEEEYILLADYVTDAVGELSLTAGEVVQLINRETTGEQRRGATL